MYVCIQALRAKWSHRLGLECDCVPSCTEAEISIVKDFKITTTEDYGTFQIELAALPSEKYRRNVVRGALDLVGKVFYKKINLVIFKNT